ncbi:MAG: DUF2339 domain-containing protein [Mariniphaga sp.]
MDENANEIDQLIEKLETLVKRQDVFSKEIQELSHEIHRLKYAITSESAPEPIEVEPPLIPDQPKIEIPVKETVETIKEPIIRPFGSQILYPKESNPEPEPENERVLSIEKFIGENLINKIGIVITVIGVAIGAKYSIDHQLISPLTRIILGYLAGLILLGFGIRLKRDYKNYSAVLVSGAMAIMYFITYFAYNFYSLMPQLVAFALMVIFTIAAVYAAIKYNMQVIAHIGLVGAYAVPFLLSNDSGNVMVLYSYMAIINIGILVIAFKKYWKSINYAAFAITWLIYIMWYDNGYKVGEHFGLALTVLAIFFSTFYLIFLAYKMIQNEKFENEDIWLLLTNSFIFYGIGYSILDSNPETKHLLGLFTILNAFIHLIVSINVYRQKLVDRNLFYFIAGLVLVFITIAVPVQLDGNWVSLFWVGEAVLLFWIGRTKCNAIYEQLSYILMVLAVASLVQDWATAYNAFVVYKPETRIIPILNINFLTSLLFILAFGYITWLNFNKKYSSPLIDKEALKEFVSYAIPLVFLFILYNSFRLEITVYWDQLYDSTAISKLAEGNLKSEFYHDLDLISYRKIWILNYSLFFLTILSFVNIKKLRNKQLGLLNLILNTIAIIAFLVQGLYAISELRESYLEQSLAQYYQRGEFNLLIRYISLIFLAGMVYSVFQYIRQDFLGKDLKKEYDLMFHVIVLWVLSSELFSWMDIATLTTHSYKLGLSILWGVYALLLISLGIWKQKKHLRIGAIVLFGLTLIKLFFYDISQLDTISKTIVFVSLGVLLLIISFLYNKFKNLILDE